MLHLARIPLLILALTLSACVFPHNGYSYYEIGYPIHTQKGVITSFRQVNISRGEESGVGTVAGAIAGSSIASSGSGSGWSGFWGAVIGGIIGGSIESSLANQIGFSYTISLDNGNNISLVQADRNPILEGTPVILETDASNRSRIIPDLSTVNQHAHH